MMTPSERRPHRQPEPLPPSGNPVDQDTLFPATDQPAPPAVEMGGAAKARPAAPADDYQWMVML